MEKQRPGLKNSIENEPCLKCFSEREWGNFVFSGVRARMHLSISGRSGQENLGYLTEDYAILGVPQMGV